MDWRLGLDFEALNTYHLSDEDSAGWEWRQMADGTWLLIVTEQQTTTTMKTELSRASGKKSNWVERILTVFAIVIVIIIRAQLTNNLNFSPSHEGFFPWERFFLLLTAVVVSCSPTSTNETFSCYRFAFISLSLLLLSLFFHFFYFSLWARTQQPSKKKRRESSWSVMSFHLTSTSHLLLSFRPGIHTFFSVALLSLVVGEIDGNFYSRAAVKWQWRWWWKKNAEICCSSGVLFE